MPLSRLSAAGLAALTVFPAYFWTPWYWREYLEGMRPLFQPVDLGSRLQEMQLEPFREIRRAVRGPWVMFLGLANNGIFTPAGFFPALLWRGWRWWRALLTGFSTSVSIELIQFFIGRSTDIDDVILNTAGTLFGFWMFWLLRAIFPNFTEKFHCQPKGGYYYG